MSDKKYAPIVVKARDGRFGEEFRIGAKADELIQWISDNKTSSGWINMQMSKRKDVGRAGQTHSVVLDTWEPNQSRRAEPVSGDDVPW